MDKKISSTSSRVSVTYICFQKQKAWTVFLLWVFSYIFMTISNYILRGSLRSSCFSVSVSLRKRCYFLYPFTSNHSIYLTALILPNIVDNGSCPASILNNTEGLPTSAYLAAGLEAFCWELHLRLRQNIVSVLPYNLYFHIPVKVSYIELGVELANLTKQSSTLDWKVQFQLSQSKCLL